MLNSRACDAMTAAAGDYAVWSEEAKGGSWLRRPGARRRSADDETSRNAFEPWQFDLLIDREVVLIAGTKVSHQVEL